MAAKGLTVGVAMLALCTGGAWARCPAGAEDAAQGIVLTLEPGLFVTYVARPDGTVESVQWADFTTERYEFVAQLGIVPVRFTMRRSDDPDAMVTGHEIVWEGEAMPLPVVGLDWQGVGARSFFSDEPGEAPGVITFDVRVTGSGEVEIGGCRYDSLQVETLMTESDATFTTEEIIDYVPDLGLAVLRRNRTVVVGEVAGDWYDWPGAEAIAVVGE
jgi:hypothetical protein